MNKKELFKFYNDFQLDSYISSSRLKFIPITAKIVKKYIDDLWEYSSDSEFYKYLEYDCFNSKQECLDYFSKLLKINKDMDGMLWIIVLKKEDKAIGTVRLAYWDLNRKNVQVGYGIAPNFSRKGYFTEALYCLTRFALEKLNFFRIESWTRSDNIGSIKGLEKLGFQYEGKLRKNNLNFDGTRHDVVIYSLLQGESFFNFKSN